MEKLADALGETPEVSVKRVCFFLSCILFVFRAVPSSHGEIFFDMQWNEWPCHDLGAKYGIPFSCTIRQSAKVSFPIVLYFMGNQDWAAWQLRKIQADAPLVAAAYNASTAQSGDEFRYIGYLIINEDLKPVFTRKMSLPVRFSLEPPYSRRSLGLQGEWQVAKQSVPVPREEGRVYARSPASAPPEAIIRPGLTPSDPDRECFCAHKATLAGIYLSYENSNFACTPGLFTYITYGLPPDDSFEPRFAPNQTPAASAEKNTVPTVSEPSPPVLLNPLPGMIPAPPDWGFAPE